MNAEALLDAAIRITEALLTALDRGSATHEEILSTLEDRERLLRQLSDGLAPSTGERAAAARLGTLDTRLARVLDDRRCAVASQLATARKRTASPDHPPRLVDESA